MASMRPVLAIPMTRKAPRPRAWVLSFLRLPNQVSTRLRRVSAVTQLVLPQETLRLAVPDGGCVASMRLTWVSRRKSAWVMVGATSGNRMDGWWVKVPCCVPTWNRPIVPVVSCGA